MDPKSDRTATLAVVAALVMLLLTLAGCLAGEETPAATWTEATGVILHGGTVWTGDPDQPQAGAVAIVGDRIAAVGPDLASIRGAAGDRPYLVDLDGGMLLPGFIDTHTHIIQAGLRDEHDGMDPFTPSVSQWDPIMGPVNQQQTALGHIRHWQDRQIEQATGVSPGLADDGHRSLDWPDPAEPPVLFRLGQEAAARYGITSMAEGGAPLHVLDTLHRYDTQGALLVRQHVYLWPEQLDEAVAAGFTLGHGTDRAQITGMKLYTDGYLGARTAALRAPYEDRPHNGFLFYSQAELDDYVVRAHQAGLRVTAHAIGDRASAAMLTSFERAAEAPCEGHTTCTDPRWGIEHASLFGPDLVDRARSLGVVVSMQPSFATSDAPWVRDAIGDRVRDLYDWPAMADAGLVLAASSDWPNEALPPLWGLERMLTRQEVDGSLAAPFQPEHAVDLETGLRMLTSNGAYLLHRDHELGSITAGKLADMVVLDRDLFAVPADTIADAEVLLTVVGGQPVHGAGRLDSLHPIATA